MTQSVTYEDIENLPQAELEERCRDCKNDIHYPCRTCPVNKKLGEFVQQAT